MKTKQQKQLLIEQLKKTPIVQVACEKVNVSRATYYRWCKEDSQFAKEAGEALTSGSLMVNDMAESQLLAAIRDKNITAIIFWLKNHHPTYGTKIEISGHLKTTIDQLSPEQEVLVKKALKLAGIDKEPDGHGQEEKQTSN